VRTRLRYHTITKRRSEKRMARFTGNTVCAEVLVDCPFSIAQDYAEAFLLQAQSGANRHMLPAFIRDRVTMTFDSHDDAEEGGRRHDELRVHWRPGMPLLPDFLATVRFRISGARTRVVIGLSYHVPFGVFGRLIDALAGARYARARAADLAARLAVNLELRQRAWRATMSALALPTIGVTDACSVAAESIT
jgi:hypothetical protein